MVFTRLHCHSPTTTTTTSMYKIQKPTCFSADHVQRRHDVAHDSFVSALLEARENLTVRCEGLGVGVAQSQNATAEEALGVFVGVV